MSKTTNVRVDLDLLKQYVEKHKDLAHMLTQPRKKATLVDLMLRKAVEVD